MKLKNILISTTLSLGIAIPISRLSKLDIDNYSYKLKDEDITNNDLEESEGALLLVNKYNPLNDGYAPLDLKKPNIPFINDSIEEEKQMREVASNAIEELFRKAKDDGINFLATSAYRSYNTQNNIYLSRVEAKGKEYTDKYVALPGKSEHQTGLSIDVTNEKRNFTKKCKEAKWLASNAYKFGFILRYPKGKEDITGISYEPWHIRYVGKKAAKEIFQKGYEVIKVSNGEEAIEIVNSKDIKLIVLDVMMPKMDGIETCKRIREKMNIPILMLSAKSEDMDKIQGIMTGADDYITKPFNPLELTVRVKALLRRAYYFNNREDNTRDNIITIESLKIDKSKHIVSVDDSEIQLTSREFDILYLLASNRGKVFSTEEIFSKVWKEQYYQSNNTVMVHMSRIRDKIEKHMKGSKVIHTVWWVGYKIEK